MGHIAVHDEKAYILAGVADGTAYVMNVMGFVRQVDVDAIVVTAAVDLRRRSELLAEQATREVSGSAFTFGR